MPTTPLSAARWVEAGLLPPESRDPRARLAQVEGRSSVYGVSMTVFVDPSGTLCLANIFVAAGLDPADVTLIRHTYTSDGLTGPADLAPDKVLDYSRQQNHRGILGEHPRPLWLCFIADGGRRSRLLVAYENHGELPNKATPEHRTFDLRPSPVLSALVDRLVIEWPRDAVRWARTGERAMSFPVLEIADHREIPFPGFDVLRLDYDQLQAVVSEPRYASWRTALAAVQGVYLITDTHSGRHYVGKADGTERILQRWRSYADNGHGGNKTLKELNQPSNFRFSLLRVFDPGTPTSRINAAEAHFKRALDTVDHGLNN